MCLHLKGEGWAGRVCVQKQAQLTSVAVVGAVSIPAAYVERPGSHDSIQSRQLELRVLSL